MSEVKSLSVARPELGEKIEQVLIEGDLAKLTPSERVSYYNSTCESLGLNPLTRPFDYIRLNNRLVLYAKKDAADQLRKIYGVSIQITSREKIDDVYVVTAKAKMPDGREDESTGAVFVGKSTGDVLANLFLKCETKAKRRVTLSICGLGILDETEVESIPAAVHVDVKEDTCWDNHVLGDSVPGDYVIRIGKKYLGKRLSEVPVQDLIGFRDWLVSKTEDGKPLSREAREFIERLEAYFDSEELGDSPPGE